MTLTENRVPRMRTLPKALEEIRKVDPDTQLTLPTLRKLVDRGIIATVPLGNYRLIDLDKLFALLSDGIPENDAAEEDSVKHGSRKAYSR